MGVDVANLANNHGMDYGPVGLRDTLTAGRRAGVPVIGAGWNDDQAYAPYRTTVNGQRIAVIGATQVLDDHLIGAWTAGPAKLGLASAKDEARLLRAVREARGTSDTVVVFLHWGLELASCPTTVQRSLARKLTAAGADVVVGSHAHVLLGGGRLGKALVAYGLGQLRLLCVPRGHVADGRARGHGHGPTDRRLPLVPARISRGIPYPLTGSAKAGALASWKSLRGCGPSALAPRIGQDRAASRSLGHRGGSSRTSFPGPPGRDEAIVRLPVRRPSRPAPVVQQDHVAARTRPRPSDDRVGGDPASSRRASATRGRGGSPPRARRAAVRGRRCPSGGRMSRSRPPTPLDVRRLDRVRRAA